MNYFYYVRFLHYKMIAELNVINHVTMMWQYA